MHNSKTYLFHTKECLPPTMTLAPNELQLQHANQSLPNKNNNKINTTIQAQQKLDYNNKSIKLTGNSKTTNSIPAIKQKSKYLQHSHSGSRVTNAITQMTK